MIVNCGWCGKHMGEKTPLSDKSLTSSICPPCAAKMLLADFVEHAQRQETVSAA
ncbi:MAG: hypothetical protein ACRD4S_16850 [Candidatus Acidiferrales bacterium]